MSEHKASVVLEVKEKLDGLVRANQAVQQFQGLLNGLGNAMPFGFAVDLAGKLTSALASIPHQIERIIEQGIELNAHLEQARINIAAVLRGTNPEEFPSFAAALKESTAILKELKHAAKDAGLEADVLVRVFNATHNAMSRGAVPIREQIRLITALSKAAQAVDARDPSRLIVGLFQGKVRETNPLAGLLGIKNEDLTAATEAGTLLEYLREKTLGVREATAEAADSWDVLVAKITTQTKKFKQGATVGIFEDAKEVMAAMDHSSSMEALGKAADALYRVGAWMVGSQARKLMDVYGNVPIPGGSFLTRQGKDAAGVTAKGITDAIADAVNAAIPTTKTATPTVDVAGLMERFEKEMTAFERTIGQTLGQLYSQSAGRLLQAPDTMARRGAYVSATVQRYQDNALQVQQGMLKELQSIRAALLRGIALDWSQI